MADNDDLFDGDGDGTDATAGSGDGDATPPAPQGGGSDAGTSDSTTESDRVRFWMSKAQSAEAEVNRLKGKPQTSKKQEAATPSGDDSGAQPDPGQDRLGEFESYMRESVRNQMFGEDARLKDFGFSLEDISGDTPAQMQASRQRLIQVIEKSQSRALNEAYEQLGIDPSIAGGSAERKDYAAMSPEEFEKEIQKAKGRSPL